MTLFGRSGYSVSQARALSVFAPNYLQKVDNDSLLQYNLDSTSSFKLNPGRSGLKSTQQLNVDWSDFSKHTFFNSAQVKVNVAYEKILNEFPFNGTESEINNYLDLFTGYENYVYDNFPKNKGYLFFSGTNVGEASGGTYVIVKDYAGVAYPGMSSKLSAESFLNPELDSMTIEMQLYVPPISNSNQAILNKVTGSTLGNINGYYVGLQNTGSLSQAQVTLYLVSGTLSEQINIPITKGEWNHISYVWDRTPGVNIITTYLNSELIGSSSTSKEFENFGQNPENLYIGSGSALLSLFTPTTTFSGAIDELRIWNSARTKNQIHEYEKKNVFNSEDLMLYYRFNEPINVTSDVIIDYSKNNLHGRLSSTGYLLGVRNIPTSSVAGVSPMTYEKLYNNPILFPDYSSVESQRETMLSSAISFDELNPNIITRLIPQHYLLDGMNKDALTTQEGFIVNELQSGTDPRSAKLGATQGLLLLMYTWAKFFDELKLYIQEFSNLYSVDYNENANTPNEFLQLLANKYGLQLPSLFQDASLAQYYDGENIESITSNNEVTLNDIQNQIWRRILINIQDIIKSKGTIYGIKAYLRAIGIDPDNNFRIREYGGPNTRNLTWVRENRSDTVKFINFVSGGLLKSNTMQATRVEPGWPYEDTLYPSSSIMLTSGSWTYEGLYKFSPNETNLTQSLVQTHVSGVVFFSGTPTWFFGNVLYNHTENVVEWVYDPGVTGIYLSSMSTKVTGVDLYDGNPWYISIGKRRNDDENVNSIVSSSYFLRVAKNINGEIYEAHTSSSWYGAPLSLDQTSVKEVFSLPAPATAKGIYFVIGSSSIGNSFGIEGFSTGYEYYQHKDFTGQVSQMRLFSKYIEDKEWKEHVRNYRSVGVQDPKTNWNFDTITSGSFNKLRSSIEVDQINLETDSLGNITFVDFAQNDLWYSGSNFPATSSNIITPYQMRYSYLSPNFDEGGTIEKVRIRSFQDATNIDLSSQGFWAQTAPVYEIPPSEIPTDSTKFTIDFSIVDYLNQDIVTILSTLEEIDSAIGNPELLYSSEYPKLEVLRKRYFNKLTDKINLKGFFEFYKWFDTNIGSFISQLLPMKTKFVGVNYVIESHMLERPKVLYHSDDVYLGESNRNGLKETFLVQLISGLLSRY